VRHGTPESRARRAASGVPVRTRALYFLRETNGTGQDPHQAAPERRMERGVPHLQIHRFDGMQGESTP
jgi:hypothetical protein